SWGLNASPARAVRPFLPSVVCFVPLACVFSSVLGVERCTFAPYGCPSRKAAGHFQTPQSKELCEEWAGVLFFSYERNRNYRAVQSSSCERAGASGDVRRGK